MYDIYGKKIIEAMDAECDYEGTQLVSINDEEVYLEFGKISNCGSDIWLDGQQR